MMARILRTASHATILSVRFGSVFVVPPPGLPRGSTAFAPLLIPGNPGSPTYAQAVKPPSQAR